MAIPLNQLLNNVFYNEQCYGKYFKIKLSSDIKHENEIFEDINKLYSEFNNNIDRDYMTINHGSQFMGGVGILNDNKFYFDSKKYNCKKIYNDMRRDWVELNFYYRNKYPFNFWGYNQSYHCIDNYRRGQWLNKSKTDPNVLNLGSNTVNNSDNKLNYFNDIMNKDLNIHKIRITKGLNKKCLRIYNVDTYQYIA
eukprot:73544_1